MSAGSSVLLSFQMILSEASGSFLARMHALIITQLNVTFGLCTSLGFSLCVALFLLLLCLRHLSHLFLQFLSLADSFPLLSMSSALTRITGVSLVYFSVLDSDEKANPVSSISF